VQQQPDDKQEFKTENGRVLQTAKSATAFRPEDDSGDMSHGTSVASKAVGRKYALAKEVSPAYFFIRSLGTIACIKSEFAPPDADQFIVCTRLSMAQFTDTASLL
jgi:hypothetical protein